MTYTKHYLTNADMAALEADLAALGLLAEDEHGDLQWTVGSGTRWPRYTRGEYDAEGNVITAPVYIEAAANVKLTDPDPRNAQISVGTTLTNGSTVIAAPSSPDRGWAEA